MTFQSFGDDYRISHNVCNFNRLFCQNIIFEDFPRQQSGLGKKVVSMSQNVVPLEAYTHVRAHTYMHAHTHMI